MPTEPEPSDFEEAFPHYEFHPLVGLAMRLARWIKRNQAHHFEASGRLLHKEETTKCMQPTHPVKPSLHS